LVIGEAAGAMAGAMTAERTGEHGGRTGEWERARRAGIGEEMCLLPVPPWPPGPVGLV
jgi:hypothetical protein